MKDIPRKTFVLKIANELRTLDSFFAKIWVNKPRMIINKMVNSIENCPIVLVIIKNQNENPAVIASALNRGDESSILYWIYESYKTTLC